ncbi:UNVERIFIED_CONTAM: protein STRICTOSIDINE SYNTHASE-LIKE 3 [Sesamum radiatum]|uniref:Protein STRICTOSIDINE SYNTHASE-LIKE 3 n=1 Tax=Sesamum radiatum TaxID=300843 RepID=A0AAW2W745_SESRA
MKPAGIFAGVCLLLAVYCAVDPFNHSVVSEFPNFETFKVEMPAWSEIPVERDRENLLQKSEIKFLNQVQGPESVAFDPAGRGPYRRCRREGCLLGWRELD